MTFLIGFYNDIWDIFWGLSRNLHIDQKVDGNCCETRLKLVQNDEKLKRNISKISFKIALDYSDLHEI